MKYLTLINFGKKLTNKKKKEEEESSDKTRLM
jgi:hypothetical protein